MVLEQQNPLLLVDGVGERMSERLKEAGITSIKMLSMYSVNELAREVAIGEYSAKKIIQSALEVANVKIGFKPLDLIWEERKRIKCLTTGSENFDDLLEGGFEVGTVNELYGGFRTGKTQLAHQLSVNVQLPLEDGGLEGGALYIDTEDSFRPERIIQMAKALKISPEKVKKSIVVAKAYNTEQQIDAIKKAGEVIEANNIKLLIIDSIANHFRNEYSKDFEGEERYSSNERNGFQILNSHLHEIKRLAEVFKLVVVITNQVFCKNNTFYGNPIHHIGGHIISHFGTNRIWIRNYECPRSERDYSKIQKFIKDIRVKTKRSEKGIINKLIITDNLQKVVRVVDSPYLPESETVFYITSDGVRDNLL